MIKRLVVFGALLLGTGCIATSGRVAKLERKVKWLETKIARLEGKVDDTRAAYDNLKSRIATVEKNLDIIFKKLGVPDSTSGKFPSVGKVKSTG